MDDYIVQPVNDWLYWTKHPAYGPWVLCVLVDAPPEQIAFARSFDQFCEDTGLSRVIFEEGV